ncbi:hypothetical protein Taro_029909 [Colocasia esculenta]|uniref:GATA-type domain-containing protein n=1 Tax=Colocasia esculenta TaxID=4460 RepID=A0A843VL17_COLES|nr:hypothetical protein [Colocasia esculenta]
MHQQFTWNYCPTDAPAEPVMPHSCGLFQSADEARRGAFSIFIARAAINEQQLPDHDGDHSCDSPSSAVDCTLSLGTPSTRHHSSPYTAKPSPLPASIQRQQRNTYSLSFDLLCTNQPKRTTPPAAIRRASVLTTGGTGLKMGGDTMVLPRRCASCDTTSTPLWRNGPRGPKSLCNACGIRYKKEERRAASSVATQSSTSCSSSPSASSAAAHLETPPTQQPQHLTTGYGGYQHPWGYPASRLAAARKCPSTILSAISLGENADPMEATALHYLPWQRYNVVVPPQAAEFTANRFQDYSLR